MDKPDLNFIQFKKLQQSDWHNIEISISDFEMKVAKCMRILGGSKENQEDHSLYAVGEEIYKKAIRPVLEDFKFLKKKKEEKQVVLEIEETDKKKKKKKEKVSLIKKEEELIFEMNLKKYEEATRELLKNFNFTVNKILYTYGIQNEKVMELKMVIFMYFGRILKKNTQETESGIEFYVGMKKIIDFIEKNNFFSAINRTLIKCSQTCVQDLEEFVDKIKYKYCYSPYIVFNKFPRLLLYNVYNNDYCPLFSIKPYKNQVELINTVEENFEKIPSLILFKSVIGSGKTTVAISLATLMSKLREKSIYGSKIKLIFACSVEIVRHYVGRLAYNSGITFAIAHTTEQGAKITNSWSCRDDKHVNLIICDLITAFHLLQKKKDYVLFIDEPTCGADKKGSVITHCFSKIFIYAPKITILSSATLPLESELKSYVDYFSNSLYKDSKVYTIISEDCFIGCKISDHSFNDYVPHINCDSVEKLKKIRDIVFSDSLLKRCYNSESLYKLYDKIIDCNIKDTPDLNLIFSNCNKLNQTTVNELSLKMLTLLIDSNNDELIRSACKSNNNIIRGKIEYNQLTESLACKFLNGCLIVCPNPSEFVNQYILPYYENYLNKFTKQLENYRKDLIEYIENKKTMKEKASKNSDSKERKIVQVEPLKIQDYLEINTYSHLQKFSNNPMSKFSVKDYKKNITFTEELNNLNIHEEYLFLLLCGIGIIDSNNSYFSKEYNDVVIRFAQEGLLAYIISTDEVAYGVNFPICNIIITKGFSQEITIGKLFQLIGRTGRVGYSWSSYAYLDEELIDYINNFVSNRDNFNNKEGINMNYSLNKNLNIDLNDQPLLEYVKENKKICIIYQFNKSEQIISTILIIIYHLKIIHKRLPHIQSFSIPLFFDFFKFHTEERLDKDFLVNFDRNYEFIYFVGMVPINPNKTFTNASKIGEKIVVFSKNYIFQDLNKVISKNVIINQTDKGESLVRIVKKYFDMIENTGLYLELDSLRYNENSEILISKIIDEFEKKKLSSEKEFISGLLNEIYIQRFEKNNISIKFVNKFLSLDEKYLMEKGKIFENEFSKEALSLILSSLSIGILFGGYNNEKKTRKKYDNLTSLIKDFKILFREAEKEYGNQVYLFVIMNNRKQLRLISSIQKIILEIINQLRIEIRFALIYPTKLEKNKKSKLFCALTNSKLDDEIRNEFSFKNIFNFQSSDSINFMIKSSILPEWIYY
jgi:hypothetical protein